MPERCPWNGTRYLKMEEAVRSLCQRVLQGLWWSFPMNERTKMTKNLLFRWNSSSHIQGPCEKLNTVVDGIGDVRDGENLWIRRRSILRRRRLWTSEVLETLRVTLIFGHAHYRSTFLQSTCNSSFTEFSKCISDTSSAMIRTSSFWRTKQPLVVHAVKAMATLFGFCPQDSFAALEFATSFWDPHGSTI